jgi:hypothetical protein
MGSCLESLFSCSYFCLVKIEGIFSDLNLTLKTGQITFLNATSRLSFIGNFSFFLVVRTNLFLDIVALTARLSFASFTYLVQIK